MAAGLFEAVHAAEKIVINFAGTQATLIDVEVGTGTTEQSVLLRGDTIVAVVKDAQLKRYAPKKLIKLQGKYLMPGLWDTHVHFGDDEALIEENRQLLPLYLSTRPEINVFLAARTGALLRCLVLAVLALRRTRRLAPHPVLFAKIHIYSRSST
ncbi:hypothetical protein ACHAC9_20810 [Massilia sp. CMS3.1]|uniref:hypothetical protein n=1 Tax=Massilia sp. CMS3.1 TaxID=3373083 RepID=UPI003EE507E2